MGLTAFSRPAGAQNKRKKEGTISLLLHGLAPVAREHAAPTGLRRHQPRRFSATTRAAASVSQRVRPVRRNLGAGGPASGAGTQVGVARSRGLDLDRGASFGRMRPEKRH